MTDKKLIAIIFLSTIIIGYCIYAVINWQIDKVRTMAIENAIKDTQLTMLSIIVQQLQTQGFVTITIGNQTIKLGIVN